MPATLITYIFNFQITGPRWASWNIGIFVCIRCAGIHRNLGVHISKVKSVNLDSWTPHQVAVSFKLTHWCLVLLCDQNSFGRSKMVLVWPNRFGLDHNDLFLTKMKLSQPKWIGQVQIVIFYQNESHLDLTNSFWSCFILVVTKSLWSSQNQFGPTKTVLVT